MSWRLFIPLLITTFFACGGNPSKPNEPNDLSEFEGEALARVDSLLAHNLEHGWVISRYQNGGFEHEGDSLLFTGIALGVLPCDKVAPIFNAVKDSVTKRGGYFVRFEPLPKSYKGDEVSRDGVSGLMFGLVRLAKRCPAYTDAVKGIWQMHMKAIGNSNVLYPGTSSYFLPGFTYVWQKVGGYLNGYKASEFEFFVSEMVTVSAIVTRKSACYPIHLATLQHLTLELLGTPVGETYKKKFCNVVKGNGLTFSDWYCDNDTMAVRLSLGRMANSPFAYSHQRCSWEEGDKRPGLIEPGLDWLLLYNVAKEGQ